MVEKLTLSKSNASSWMAILHYGKSGEFRIHVGKAWQVRHAYFDALENPLGIWGLFTVALPTLHPVVG